MWHCVCTLSRVHRVLRSSPNRVHPQKAKRNVILDQVILAGFIHNGWLSRKVIESKHPPPRLRNLAGEGAERTLKMEAGEDSCEKMFSGHDMTIALMMSL